MDIAAFRRRPDGSAQSLTGHSPDGDTVDGPAKVAQWVVTQLFSRRGVTPFRGDEGTPLAAALVGGQLATDADVFAAFSAAAAVVRSIAVGVETTDTPADERLAAVSLKKLSIASGRLSLTVVVVTATAATRTVIVDLDLLTA